MSWFRVDDKAAFHRKVLKAGNEAFGAFARMGSWSSDHLTDGRVPIETALLIANEHVLQKLCFVGLLEPDGADFVIHDFLDYNPSAEEIREERAHNAEVKAKAGRAGGIASGVARRANKLKQNEAEPKQGASSSVQANAKQNEAPSRPVPFPPEQEESSLAPVRVISAEPWGTKNLHDLWFEVVRKTPSGDWTVLHRLTERIAASARARGVTDVEAHARGLLQSFVAVVDGWRDAKRPRPQKSVEAFEKHFTAAEEVIDGERDPKCEIRPVLAVVGKAAYRGPSAPCPAIPVGEGGELDFAKS